MVIKSWNYASDSDKLQETFCSIFINNNSNNFNYKKILKINVTKF